jgi:SAM-dependent MidA family methyltransferase
VQQLTQLGAPLAHYDILEISPDLAKRQQERLAAAKKQHAWHTELRWLQTMPKTFVGIILANEVLDALPCEVIMLHQGRWFFQGVGVVAEQLQWSTGGAVPKDLLPHNLQNTADFLAKS